MKKYKVALIGAGPGDAGLLTLKAAELLKSAEVVIYDRLVSKEVLALVNPSAQMINAGKESSKHSIPQDEINQLLVDHALSGKFTVRLKGGDPFVFGRIGEELEALCANGIKYEIVPGVTSAVAAPGYAGIPLTHRNFCSSLHVVTGHAREGGKLDINFEALVALNGTIVFMMGISNLKDLTEGLLNAGMDKDTPAAVVENGTRKNQRQVFGSLSEIYTKVKAETIMSPSVVVVGKVCGLGERFCWFTPQNGGNE